MHQKGVVGVKQPRGQLGSSESQESFRWNSDQKVSLAQPLRGAGMSNGKGQKALHGQQKLTGFSSPRWACWLCPSESSEPTGVSLSSEADAAKTSRSSAQTHPHCWTWCLQSRVYLADNRRFAWNATRFIKYFRDTILWGLALIKQIERTQVPAFFKLLTKGHKHKQNHRRESFVMDTKLYHR